LKVDHLVWGITIQFIAPQLIFLRSTLTSPSQHHVRIRNDYFSKIFSHQNPIFTACFHNPSKGIRLFIAACDHLFKITIYSIYLQYMYAWAYKNKLFDLLWFSLAWEITVKITFMQLYVCVCHLFSLNLSYYILNLFLNHAWYEDDNQISYNLQTINLSLIND
jgi:hypothetical protein